MDRKIRIGAVSYLNTKPLIYGLEKGMLQNELELTLDTPAATAKKLLSNEIDCGLVPVAILPLLAESHIISDYGICCNGEVASVCIFSEVPLEEVEELLLDYQSRTSVRLAQVLLKHYWKLQPELVPTGEDFRHRIKGKTGAVLIGDRALEQRKTAAFVYDLGEAWLAFTGLPFVFATWISNKLLPAEFCAAFNQANQYGLDRLDEVIARHPYPIYSLEDYYTRNIHYRLGEDEMKGLQRFLEFIRNGEFV